MPVETTVTDEFNLFSFDLVGDNLVRCSLREVGDFNREYAFFPSIPVLIRYELAGSMYIENLTLKLPDLFSHPVSPDCSLTNLMLFHRL